LSHRVQRWPGSQRLFDVSYPLAGAGPTETDAAPTETDAAPISLAELFREHHLELVRLALVMVGDLATAEDVVQDAFERVHRRWHGLREPSNGLAYIRSSVLNGCRSVHRRAAVARKHLPRLAGSSAALPDGAVAADDRSELVAALRALSSRQREVLVLRYYVDLDVGEIAEILRIAPSAVRSTCARGLAALAGLLREDEQ
jgi:RNA polymerase sigma-70 factor (sigma-E family)